MSFQSDLDAWAQAQFEKLARQRRISLTRLIRQLIGPQPRDLTPGAARPGDRFASRRPVPNAAAGTVFAYLESGLATFSGSDDDGALVTYHSALAASVALRQADDIFGLVGNGFVRASDGSASYPSIPPTDGVDFVPNSRSSRVPWNASSDYIPASTFSGHLMQLWVQAKYGSDSSVSAVSLFSTTISGATVANTAAQSHWVYEHEDAERIGWWGIEANSGGALKAGLMVLDAAAERLSDYFLLHTGEISAADRDWLRAWIFRGASWPASEDMIEVEATLPAVGGLGYGWHVSASGALASIHTYELVDTGSSPVHHGSEWTRWDLTLSLEYVAGAPVWGADVTDTATGYLETGHYNGITVWTLGVTGTPAPFITDPSVSAPDPLASDAEVWGWYEGEIWNGINVTDSGTSELITWPAPATPTCETSSYRVQINAGYARSFSIGDVSAVSGTDIRYGESNWAITGSYDWPEWQSCPAPVDCLDYTYSSCDGGWSPDNASCRWSGSGGLPQQIYVDNQSPTTVSGLALVLAIGCADGCYEIKQVAKTATIAQQTSYSGSVSTPTYAVTNSVVYKGCWTGSEYEWKLYSVGEGTGPNVSTTYNYDVSSISQLATKTTISATLRTSKGDLLVYSSEGGTGGDFGGVLGAEYSGSGTIDLNGWTPYIDTGILDPAPEPIYAISSAVAGVLSGCTGPGCSSTEATDTGAASPMPIVPVWLGGA